MATMNSGLGGAAGYGENVFSSTTKTAGNNDDGSVQVDVTSVFGGSGINYFGTNYTDVYVNSNGILTFEGPETAYSPVGLGGYSDPAVAPFWTDIDITKGGEIYWDLDPTAGTFTVTWHDVAPFSSSGTNSFQVVFTDTGSGNFDIEYIYEDIQFSNGGSGDATVGITDGANIDYELEGSSNASILTNYENNDFDGGDPNGTFNMSVVDGLPDAVIVTGTAGDDTIGVGFLDINGSVVTDQGDYISAGAGNDSIDGGDGDDTIDGGVGNDTILSGSDAGATAITYTNVGNGATATGTSGTDYYRWTATSGSNSTIKLNNSAAAGDGDGVADYLLVDTTNNTGTLTVGDFDIGTDKIILQQSWSSFSVSNSSGLVSYELTYSGGNTQTFDIYHDDSTPVSMSEIFTTVEPTVTISDNDSLSGGDDADTFIVEDLWGSDTITGGEGGTDNDRIDFSDLTGPVTVSYSGSELGTVNDGTDTLTFSEIEAFTLTDGADSLNATSDTSGVIVVGGDGSDTIIGGAGGDSIDGGTLGDSIDAGAGDDTVLGGNGNDTIQGGSGNDSLDGESAADIVYGGAGNDTINAGNNQDTVYGGDDSDFIYSEGSSFGKSVFGGEGGSDDDTLSWSTETDAADAVNVTFSGNETGSGVIRGQTVTFSEIENIEVTQVNDTVDASATTDGVNISGLGGDDSLTGGTGNDTFLGGDGADTISGGDGDDYIDGGDGDDFLTTGLGQDTLVGGDGNDTLMNSAGDDSLVGGTGDDSIVATAGDDTLEGGSGNDTLDGGSENDSIVGGAGDDVIYTGLGNDEAFGGDDADTFHVHGAEGVEFNQSGTDGLAQVSGFSDFPTDALSFEIQFSTDGTGPSEPTFVSYASSGDTNDFLVYADSSDILRVGIDGNILNTGYSISDLFDDLPHSLAVTWDGTTGAIEIYADGASIFSGTHATGASITQGGTLVFGQEQDSIGGGFDTNQRFQGEIHNAKLFNDVRTAGEIASDAGDHEADTSNPNLIAGWVPDADTGGLTDLTGNNTMTMSGDTQMVTGLGGDDTITGGEGGTDDDTIDLSALTGPVTVTYTGDEQGTITDGTDTVTFSQIENINLTDFDDSVDGLASDAPMTIDGRDGNDTITGGDGNDTILGGDGNDVLDGDDADDSVDGGAGDDTLLAGFGTDTFIGGSGTDTYQIDGTLVEGFAFNIDLNAGSDQYGNSYSGIENIIGGDANDTLTGDGNDNLLDGRDGADTFNILDGFGSDTIVGGEGGTDSDTIDLSALTGPVTVTYTDDEAGTITDGTDTITFSEIENIFLTEFDDSVDGSGVATDMNIFAGDGDDTIYSGSGDDTIDGGDGADLIYGDDLGDPVELINGDLENGVTGGNYVLDTLEGWTNDNGDIEVWADGHSGINSDDGGNFVELDANPSGTDPAPDNMYQDVSTEAGRVYSLSFKGLQRGADDESFEVYWGGNLIGTFNPSSNTTWETFSIDVVGSGGTDRLEFRELVGENDGSGPLLDAISLTDTSSNDSIDGGAGDDTIYGGYGADTINGGAGADSIEGGIGNDNIRYAVGGDTVDGGAGDDTILGGFTQGTDDAVLRGGDGNDAITTYGADDTVYGDAGNDTIVGDSGDEYLDGGADDDEIYAGSGNDTILGGTGNDSLFGDGDDDWLRGGDGNDTIDGGSGNDSINGENDDDSITGGAGEDTIWGDAGNDTLDGGADDDSLGGGGGDDSLIGGDGSDSLSGMDGADTLVGGAGNDTLQGGEGGDSIRGGDGLDIADYSGSDAAVNIDLQNGINSGGHADGDTLIGVDGITGSAFDDSLTGFDTSGADWTNVIDGGAGNDTIDGRGSDDTLIGGSGDDSIIGGTGDDAVTGGTGNDRFTYTVGDGHDTITDFNAGNTGTLSDGDNTNNDFIDLSGFYDNLSELYADQADDGILNQSNTTDSKGRSTDYSDNSQFGSGSMRMQGASADNSSFSEENTGVVCFTSGTAIRTPRGDVLIDDLKVGDLVNTMDNGPQRIRWIGNRIVGKQELMANPKLRPILIKRGILSAERDLLVSPQHGVLIEPEHLARATHLIKRPGIRIANGKREVTYFHVMFDAHQIIFAENVPSESFFPGPMGLEMISDTARVSLKTAFPELGAGLSRLEISEIYGNTVRNFTTK